MDDLGVYLNVVPYSGCISQKRARFVFQALRQFDSQKVISIASVVWLIIEGRNDATFAQENDKLSVLRDNVTAMQRGDLHTFPFINKLTGNQQLLSNYEFIHSLQNSPPSAPRKFVCEQSKPPVAV